LNSEIYQALGTIDEETISSDYGLYRALLKLLPLSKAFSSASSKPSVARRILDGKMLIFAYLVRSDLIKVYPG
jgi:hypothetical protein